MRYVFAAVIEKRISRTATDKRPAQIIRLKDLKSNTPPAGVIVLIKFVVECMALA